MKRDYYEILGLSHNASGQEIKSAYRKKALEYHPDRNPSREAEEKFKEASEAYEVLSDPQNKALYDQFGHAGLEGHGFHGFTDVSDVFSHFSDLFEDFFGIGSRSARGRSRSFQGRDLRYDLAVSFMEAFHGTEKKIEVMRHESCKTCGGQGHPKGQEPVVCQYCGGRGQLFHSQGFFTISSACHACGGQGRTFREHCPQCQGKGLVEKTKDLSLKIPPGVDTGTSLCLRGEGEGGARGGAAGDLYVVLDVEEHPAFKRQGADLLLERRLSFVEAALGQEISVMTPEGEEKMKLSPGTQTGDVLRVKEKGMPRLRGHGRGDLLVHCFVETPRDLTQRQREILEEFSLETKPRSGKEESSFTKSAKHSKKPKRWF